MFIFFTDNNNDLSSHGHNVNPSKLTVTATVVNSKHSLRIFYNSLRLLLVKFIILHITDAESRLDWMCNNTRNDREILVDNVDVDGKFSHQRSLELRPEDLTVEEGSSLLQINEEHQDLEYNCKHHRSSQKTDKKLFEFLRRPRITNTSLLVVLAVLSSFSSFSEPTITSEAFSFGSSIDTASSRFMKYKKMRGSSLLSSSNPSKATTRLQAQTETCRFITNKMCPFAQKAWICIEAANLQYKMEQVCMYVCMYVCVCEVLLQRGRRENATCLSPNDCDFHSIQSIGSDLTAQIETFHLIVSALSIRLLFLISLYDHNRFHCMVQVANRTGSGI